MKLRVVFGAFCPWFGPPSVEESTDRESHYDPVTVISLKSKCPPDAASSASGSQHSWFFTGCLGFLGLLCLTGSLLLFLGFKDIVGYFVSKQVVLSPHSLMFHMWKEPPVGIYLDVYFFNITNANRFPWNEEKPAFQEIGPYVYREHWKRIGIRWNDNGTVTYRKRRIFTFEPALSMGSEDDVITTLNMPVLAAANLFKTARPLVKFALSSVFRVLHESLVVRKSVRELAFEGYEDPLIKVAKDILGTYPHRKFAYFAGRNNSDDGVFNVFTGEESSQMFSQINSWNGLSETNIWTSKTCNQINGTDGASYSPMLDGPKNVNIFVPDFCRSFEFSWVDSVEFMKLPSYVFEPTEEMMEDGWKLHGTQCFCSGTCLGTGVINITKCQYGAPVFLTFPHFYKADPKFAEAVDGLQPIRSFHSSSLTIEPLSGVPLQVDVKFQLNAFVENMPHFSYFSKLHSKLMPLLWFSQRYEMPREVADLIYWKGHIPYYYGRLANYWLLALGMVFALASLLLFCFSGAIKMQQKNERHVGNKHHHHHCTQSVRL